MINIENEQKSNNGMFENLDIADEFNQEQTLVGIQPKNQAAFSIYKKIQGLAAFTTVFIIGSLLIQFLVLPYLKIGINILIVPVVLALFFAFCMLLLLLLKLTFLKKPKFDTWIFEVAKSVLNTQVIFYDRHRLYIQCGRRLDLQTKEDFVKEMSALSDYYTYFYDRTYIDEGFITCTVIKKVELPEKALAKPEDDVTWNLIPLGLVVNPETQKISKIGWYINDDEKDKDALDIVPSVSMIIVGGTGCHGKNELIRMYDEFEL